MKLFIVHFAHFGTMADNYVRCNLFSAWSSYAEQYLHLHSRVSRSNYCTILPLFSQARSPVVSTNIAPFGLGLVIAYQRSLMTINCHGISMFFIVFTKTEERAATGINGMPLDVFEVTPKLSQTVHVASTISTQMILDHVGSKAMVIGSRSCIGHSANSHF